MKKDLADITLVLDRSGSMKSCAEATIAGFNNFRSEQLKVPGEARLSVVQFDDQYEVLYEGKPLPEADELTAQTFVPRGLTRLLDALGKTINRTGERLKDIPESDRPEHIIFVVITDGEENSSAEYTRDKVFEMIRHQEDQYNWRFIFLGANQDAIATGASLGIMRGSAMNYAGTDEGTRQAYLSASNEVTDARTGR